MTADLIAKLEAAESGSRELDHDIAHAVFQNVTPAMRAHDSDGWLHPEYGKIRCEDYTTSLDAIVALIGEKLPLRQGDLIYKAMSYLNEKHALHCRFWKTEIDGEFGEKLALALCSALLRALFQPVSGEVTDG